MRSSRRNFRVGRIFACLALMAAAPALSGCPAIVTAMVERAYQDRPAAYQVSDVRIHGRILAFLVSINAELTFDVNTDVWLGRVLLTGTLGEKALREKIVEYARRDKRARAVYDHIRIVSRKAQEKRRRERGDKSTAQSINDAWISAKVKVRLLASYEVKSVNYRWQTVLGRVYIIGTARTRAERKLILRILNRTKGIRGVTSYIGILKIRGARGNRSAAK